jgi:hypothetical protein
MLWLVAHGGFIGLLLGWAGKDPNFVHLRAGEISWDNVYPCGPVLMGNHPPVSFDRINISHAPMPAPGRGGRSG